MNVFLMSANACERIVCPRNLKISNCAAMHTEGRQVHQRCSRQVAGNAERRDFARGPFAAGVACAVLPGATV